MKPRPLFILLLVTSGCATQSGVVAIPPVSGDEVLYAGGVREAALAVRNAIMATRLEILEAGELARGDDEPATWYALSRGPAGGYVRVVCEETDVGVVAVRIIQRRGRGLNSPGEWRSTLFALIGLELDRIDPGTGHPP